MGITHSHQVATDLLSACDSEGSLNRLYCSATSLATVQAAAAAAPADVKSALLGSLLPPKRNRLNKLSALEQIVVPAKIEKRMKEWLAQPGTLFTCQLTPGKKFSDIAAILRSLRTADETGDPVTSARHRVSCAALHKLFNKFGRQNDPAVQALVKILAKDNEQSSPTLETLRSWARTGGRLLSIAKELGGMGVLLVLPQSGIQTWTRDLPCKGDDRDKIVEGLKQRGIVEAAEKCTNVAVRSLQYLKEEMAEWEPVMQSSQTRTKRASSDGTARPTCQGGGKRRRTTRGHNTVGTAATGLKEQPVQPAVPYAGTSKAATRSEDGIGDLVSVLPETRPDEDPPPASSDYVVRGGGPEPPKVPRVPAHTCNSVGETESASLGPPAAQSVKTIHHTGGWDGKLAAHSMSIDMSRISNTTSFDLDEFFDFEAAAIHRLPPYPP